MEKQITLATLEQATEQEVFDQVAHHMLTQNAKSGTSGEIRYRCMYRMEGLKCAAGCLIGDLEYRSIFEDKSWDELAFGGSVPKAHAALIQDLQGVHDFSEVEAWSSLLLAVAEKYDLSPAVIEEFWA